MPAPEYSITELWPGDGASGVARDAGFVIYGVASSEPGGPGFDLDVQLIDVETGLTQPLRAIEWYAEQPSAAWYPEQALLPNHTYRLLAQVDDGQSPPGPVSSTFTTGDARLESLSLEGDIEVSLEGYDELVHECQSFNSCGPSDCVPVGTRRALRARLTLPAARGGQTVDGRYGSRLYLTDATPPLLTEPNVEGRPHQEDQHEIFGAGYLELSAGQHLQRELSLPQESFAYAPCFTWVVWDPAGNKQELSKCLPALSPADYLTLSGASAATPADAPLTVEPPSAAAASATPAGSTAEPRDVELGAGAPSTTSSGCVVTRTATGPGAAWLALGALAALSRRRARRTPPRAARR